MKAPHSFDMSGMYTPNDMVSHPRSHEPSAIVLWECQISYRRNILQTNIFCFAGHRIIPGAASDPVHWLKSWS